MDGLNEILISKRIVHPLAGTSKSKAQYLLDTTIEFPEPRNFILKSIQFCFYTDFGSGNSIVFDRNTQSLQVQVLDSSLNSIETDLCNVTIGNTIFSIESNFLEFVLTGNEAPTQLNIDNVGGIYLNMMNFNFGGGTFDIRFCNFIVNIRLLQKL